MFQPVITSQFRARPDGKDRRILEVRCAWRPCGVKNDSIVQSRNADDSWGPDVPKLLQALGWVTQDAALFCSKHCAHLHAYHAARGIAPKPVERIDDAQYEQTIARSPERVRNAPSPAIAATAPRASTAPTKEPPPLLGPKQRVVRGVKSPDVGKDPRAP
jgi:hypothetical protein